MRLQHGLIGLSLAAALGCGPDETVSAPSSTTPVQSVKINSEHPNSTLAHFIAIDGDHQPALEDDLEQKYGFNILGEPDKLTDESLAKLTDNLSAFESGQLYGLNIVLGHDGSKTGDYDGLRGRLFPATAYGPTAFIKYPESQKTISHELTHFLHYSIEDFAGFGERWSKIQTVVPRAGELVPATLEEALSELASITVKDENDNLFWSLYDGGEFRLGHFGFGNPYGSLNSGEAVGVLGELVFGNGIDELATGDPNFPIQTYINQFKLMSEYGVISGAQAETATTRLQQRYDETAAIRELPRGLEDDLRYLGSMSERQGFIGFEEFGSDYIVGSYKDENSGATVRIRMTKETGDFNGVRITYLTDDAGAIAEYEGKVSLRRMDDGKKEFRLFDGGLSFVQEQYVNKPGIDGLTGSFENSMNTPFWRQQLLLAENQLRN